MQLDNIPSELKQLRQWVVWKSVIKGSRVTKPPFMSKDPNRQASTTDPSTWSSYEEAIECCKNNASTVAGIGFVFSKDDNYYGIDMDSESKVLPEDLERRRQFIGQILTIKSYTETSPSGDGLHLIAKGKMPCAGTQAPKLGIEVYSCNRFFTMTGNVYNNQMLITTQQEFIDALQFRQINDTFVADTDEHRALDLTDDEVLQIARRDPTFSKRFDAQQDCDPGEWSHTYMALLGGLDKITGSVKQVQRIIYDSAFVQSSPNTTGGETRPHKARRIFEKTLGRVRYGNTANLEMEIHGKEQALKILASFERQREEKLAEAARIAEQTFGKLSKNSKALLGMFPELTTEHRLILPPPGLMGQFVEAAKKASYRPCYEMAIPATLSVFSGIFGRRYKIDNSGLNLNFILTAKPGMGKSQSQKVWERFLSQANRCLPRTVDGPPNSRLIQGSTSSIQGIMGEFAHIQAGAWFIEECAGQLSAMSNETNTVGVHLRNAYNNLWDCSEATSHLEPPKSQASKKDGIAPIPNLCISTYWTATHEQVKVNTNEISSGLLSRLILVRHMGYVKDEEQPETTLPEDLRNQLCNILSYATEMDNAHKLGGEEPFKKIVQVDDSQIKNLHSRFRRICESVIYEATVGDQLTEAYTVITRVPNTAMRMAATLAVLESPYSPSITEEQYKWSFGYVLHYFVALLSALDTGDVGAGENDDVNAVMRAINKMFNKKTEKTGVPRRELHNKLRSNKPFSLMTHKSPSKAANETLEYMKEQEMILIKNETVTGHGPEKQFIIPLYSHPAWCK